MLGFWRAKGISARLLKLLFDSAAATLLEFGRGELGGQVGLTLVLHTWDQQLRPHYHLHGLIAAGALTKDGSRWIAGGAKFLFPVRALSKLFRGKFLAGFEKLLEAGKLKSPAEYTEGGKQPQAMLRKLRKKPWVVYSKAPFARPAKLLDYLSRYTHRVAIANHRLVSCLDGQVSFRYRDRTDGDRRKTKTLPVDQFIGRFGQGSHDQLRHSSKLAIIVVIRYNPQADKPHQLRGSVQQRFIAHRCATRR